MLFLQSEDEQLARALALSMEEAGSSPEQQQQQQQLSPRSAAAAAAAARAPVAPPPQPAAPPARPQQPLPKPRAASPIRSHPPPSRSNGSNGVGANVTGLQQATGGAPVCVLLPGGAVVVRRVIDSDNSCLFNAVGYVMEGSRTRAPALRAIIARDVIADPLSWSEAVLGKEPGDYCSWIQRKDSWGGAIELSILSRWVPGE